MTKEELLAILLDIKDNVKERYCEAEKIRVRDRAVFLYRTLEIIGIIEKSIKKLK